MATVTVEGTDLVVEMTGLDRLLTLTRRLTVPLAHVRGATADPGIVGQPKGRRAPGTHVPGLFVGGTFVQDGQKIFWSVRDEKNAVVIQLDHEKFTRLVVEVEDPRTTIRLIEQSVPPRATVS